MTSLIYQYLVWLLDSTINASVNANYTSMFSGLGSLDSTNVRDPPR